MMNMATAFDALYVVDPRSTWLVTSLIHGACHLCYRVRGVIHMKLDEHAGYDIRLSYVFIVCWFHMQLTNC